jgi:hypothetical protein
MNNEILKEAENNCKLYIDSGFRIFLNTFSKNAYLVSQHPEIVINIAKMVQIEVERQK